MSILTTERVAKGATLLDEYEPGWWKMIHLGSLQLKDCTFCILGQLFDDYEEGLPALGLSDIAAAESGFAEPGDLPWRDTDYPALDAEWKRLILARRERGLS